MINTLLEAVRVAMRQVIEKYHLLVLPVGWRMVYLVDSKKKCAIQIILDLGIWRGDYFFLKYIANERVCVRYNLNAVIAKRGDRTHGLGDTGDPLLDELCIVGRALENECCFVLEGEEDLFGDECPERLAASDEKEVIAAMEVVTSPADCKGLGGG